MFTINKNKTVGELGALLAKTSMVDLNKEYNVTGTLEQYKERLALEEIIEETVCFNKQIKWDHTIKKLSLAVNAEDLLEVYKLRSLVYSEINYQKECPDFLPGLNLDNYDKNSAIILYKQNNEVTGTCRLIYDSKQGLPSEEKFCFSKQRDSFNKIAEISRNIVKYRNKGLNLEFKYLMRGVYYITMLNNIDLTLFGIKKDDLKLFNKLGGLKVLEELNSYGEVNLPFLIVSRESKKTTNFFKKLFL